MDQRRPRSQHAFGFWSHQWLRAGFVWSLILCQACSEADAPDDPWGSLAAPDRVLVEVFRLGGLEPAAPEIFDRDPRMVVDQDRRLYILHGMQGRVAVFDREGAFLRWIGGGRGQGPGEFSSPARMGLLGDTLWIRNLSPAHIALFRTDGTLLRTDPVLVGSAPNMVPATQGLSGYLAEGGAWVEPDGPPTAPRERATGRSSLELGTQEVDEPRDTVLTWRSNRGRLAGLFFDPIPEPPFFAVAPDGSEIVLAEWSDDQPDQLNLRVLAADGAERWEGVIALGLRPISSEERDAIVEDGRNRVRELREDLLERGLPPAGVPEIPTVLEARELIFLPAHVPPIRDVRLGIDGTIWLHLERAGSTQRWVALDPDEGVLFGIDLPEGASFGQGTRNALWYSEADELDVTWVVKARLSGGETPDDGGGALGLENELGRG